MELKSEEAGSGQNFRELLEKYDYFIFDCDGVIWQGEHLIPGSDLALKEI